MKVALANPTTVAIATRHAAQLYGTRVVKEDIEDRFGNQASFALIGRPGISFPLAGSR